jgi:hypothetical protein
MKKVYKELGLLKNEEEKKEFYRASGYGRPVN